MKIYRHITQYNSRLFYKPKWQLINSQADLKLSNLQKVSVPLFVGGQDTIHSSGFGIEANLLGSSACRRPLWSAVSFTVGILLLNDSSWSPKPWGHVHRCHQCLLTRAFLDPLSLGFAVLTLPTPCSSWQNMIPRITNYFILIDFIDIVCWCHSGTVPFYE